MQTNCQIANAVGAGPTDWFGALVESMTRVNEWEISRYELLHKPTGLILWIASGWLFLEADEDSTIPLKLTLLERMRLWPHIKRIRNAMVVQKLNAPQQASGPMTGPQQTPELPTVVAGQPFGPATWLDGGTTDCINKIYSKEGCYRCWHCDVCGLRGCDNMKVLAARHTIKGVSCSKPFNRICDTVHDSTQTR